VSAPNKLEATKIFQAGSDFDMANYNKVVELSEKQFRSLFQK
jgi:hypothetical protein